MCFLYNAPVLVNENRAVSPRKLTLVPPFSEVLTWCTWFVQKTGVFSSVADPHHFYTDTDPDFHLNADPDPTFHSGADPDPSF